MTPSSRESTQASDNAAGRTSRRWQPQAFRLFFAGATLLAVLLVPLWILQYLGVVAPWADRTASLHGHEMVFGYALAVVGGYLITRASATMVVAAFCAWLAGRIVFLGPPVWPPLSAAVALAFPAVLFAIGGLPFLRAAKSWRNAVFGLLLGGFLAAEVLYQLGALDLLPAGRARGAILGIDLVVLLLFTMGGRIIAAATSGAIQAKGSYLKGVAQPRLERAGVVALVAMSLLDALQWGAPVSAILAAAAAAIIALRLARWQFWRVMDVAEVSTLHLGYAWISVGLVVKAAAQGLGVMALFEATHGVMIGGLGTLSLAMMARVALQRLRRPATFPPPVLAAIGLVSAAAVLRLLAVMPDLRIPLIEAAAVAWTAAFAVFAWFFFRLFLAGADPRTSSRGQGKAR